MFKELKVFVPLRGVNCFSKNAQSVSLFYRKNYIICQIITRKEFQCKMKRGFYTLTNVYKRCEAAKNQPSGITFSAASHKAAASERGLPRSFK